MRCFSVLVLLLAVLTFPFFCFAQEPFEEIPCGGTKDGFFEQFWPWSHLSVYNPFEGRFTIQLICNFPELQLFYGGLIIPSDTCFITRGTSEIDTVLRKGPYHILYRGMGSYQLRVWCGEHQLPVELTTFKAIAGEGQVILRWTTASEQDNDHFEVLRSIERSIWTTVGTVEGQGNSQTAIDYKYTDYNVVNDVTYFYRLVSYDINGTIHEYEQIVEVTPKGPVPVEYALEQNFPNPFNPNTVIKYALKEPGLVTLTIYNLLGQKIAIMVSQEMDAGQHTASFTATDLPSGIYIYQLEVNDFVATKKMVLLK